MKRTATLSLILALSASGLAIAQSNGMKGMEMKDMDMQKCMEMMNGMGSKQQGSSAKTVAHNAAAVVKNVDAANGKVTLAHEPVKSLNWPAMTMGFAVKDKKLFDKLAVGKKVNVDILQQGSDYVVTAVR